MKKTILRIVSISGFLLMTLLGLHKIYDVLRWKDTTGGYLSSIDQLYHTDENRMDLVFVGSSHCYYGVYPELLWKENGIAAFDLAVSAQDVSSAYYQLKELLKTQHPKVVAVDIYGICYEEHLVESNIYRNYLSMKTSLNSAAHIMSYGEWEDQKELLAKWPIIHTRYNELKEYDFVQYEPSITGRGSLLTWNVTPVEEGNGVNHCETIEPLSERNREWVDNMLELSREEDFQLIFMLIPWKRGDDKQAILNGFREYVQDMSIDFLDLTPLAEKEISSATDWTDAEHLNAWGAQKLTRRLSEYLLENYDLPDRRNEAGYSRWEEALERYSQIEMINQLTTTPYIEEYISLLAQMPRVTCILSLEGAYAASASDIYGYVSLFAMDYEEYRKGGKWLYQDGQLTKLCENIPGSEYIYDLSEIDTLKVGYRENFAGDNILIDGTGYGNTGSGLQIIVYDNIENKVIQTKEIY
ncbi:MAG: hypothetical protein NC432_13430 [Roseburia sp.]|nr:hypothetical protein [Roseburia sp.]MCM1096861.1 hypothetical protein [Ruminococcus flavefaciens]